MKRIAQMSMEELAAYVCSKLEEEGIKTVLSGGSCVQIYSQGKYTSDDIDLIDRFNGGHTLIKKVMFTMGFKEHNRYFVHDDTEWFIEFPRGPLGVGDAPVHDIATIEEETGILKLLTPTDYIKDRLAAYYHWDHPLGLQNWTNAQSLTECGLASIEEWPQKENMLEKYQIFRKRVDTD